MGSRPSDIARWTPDELLAMSMSTDKWIPTHEWLPMAIADLVATVKRAIGETVREDQLLGKWGFDTGTADLTDDDIRWMQFAERLP